MRRPCAAAGFGCFAAWILSPFVLRRKTFHAIVVFKRVLVVLVTCQTLRIITFLSTQAGRGGRGAQGALQGALGGSGCVCIALHV